MGVKIEQFSFPLCTSFKAKLYKDQLCYTVDPNEFKHRIDLKGQLSITLAIDYNEDRVYKFSNESLGEVKQKVTDHFDEISHDYSDTIIIETIDPLELSLDSSYNLNVITEVTVTASFLSLQENVRNCQEKDSLAGCMSKIYIDDLKDTCKCLPLKLGLQDEAPMCRPDQMECVAKISLELQSCLKSVLGCK